jgi:transposase
MTVKDKEKMKGSDVEKYYSIIEEHYPAVKLCSEIWISFHDIIMGKDPDQLDDFLDKYEVSPITPFINGIKKDIAPVKAAISSPVSSGFVEGGNCRYKATKRLMFGRSGLRHLFLKTYAVSIIMRSAKSVSGLITHWLNS